MAERFLASAISALKERVSPTTRTFSLYPGGHVLSIGDRARGTHPVINVPMSLDDKRLIGGDLELEVTRCCSEEQEVEITVRKHPEDPKYRGKRINLRKADSSGGILNLDGIGQITCSEIDDDGRAHLHMAIKRGIDVHSAEHRMQLD